jgi:hypothetical protein
MTTRGLWDAVSFVPYRKDTRQTTPPPNPSQTDDVVSSSTDPSSQDLKTETKPDIGHRADVTKDDHRVAPDISHRAIVIKDGGITIPS